MKKMSLFISLILVQSYSWASMDPQACKRVSNGSYSVNNVDGAQNIKYFNEEYV